MSLEQFESRKTDHIREALRAQNEATGQGGFDRVHLFHDALPEFNLEDVDLSTSTLKHSLKTPFFVCGMTAGHPGAQPLNWTIAEAAQERGWAMGVGSQRRELEFEDSDAQPHRQQHQQIDAWKTFRKKFPRLVLFGNIGASQLVHFSVQKIQRLVDSLEPQALCIHLNPLQEAIQPEGTPNFKGVLAAINSLCHKLSVPVILKETGCGFSPQTLLKLKDSGISAIDVSGLGGTHWGRIEGARAPESSMHSLLAKTFANWGESTVDSLIYARQHFPSLEVWASGGIRNGLDAAKSLAVGARLVGFAKPVLEHALIGEESLQAWMKQVEAELRIALFCTGSRTPQELGTEQGKRWKKT